MVSLNACGLQEYSVCYEKKFVVTGLNKLDMAIAYSLRLDFK